jgi:hypothetical protein
VTVEAEVADVSRQYIAGSTTAIVHPAEFYVALTSGADLFVDAGKPIEPKVFTVDPKGTRVPGVSVKIDLVQRTWNVARQATTGGSTHTVATHVDKVGESCTVTTTAPDKPASCKLTPATSGYPSPPSCVPCSSRSSPTGTARSTTRPSSCPSPATPTRGGDPVLDLDVVDAHHHLCHLSAASYPWLAGPPVQRYHGDDLPLRRDYLLDDYRTDAAQLGALGARLVGSVHVENGAADPLWESRWIDAVIAWFRSH